MDTTAVSSLINSISRLIHLVSCQTKKSMPNQNEYRSIVMVLKRLKPALDEIVDSEVSSYGMLQQACEQLDEAVNDARNFMEHWSTKMSKIISVLHSGNLLTKIQSLSIEICHILCRQLQCSQPPSCLSGILELSSLKDKTTAAYIEEALRSERDGRVPCTHDLVKIINTFNLTSNQELLKESIAVEKRRMNDRRNRAKGDMDLVNQIIDLMSHIRSYLLKAENLEGGVALPPYFRCPLSLELMLDPVIVASGQTYERDSIKKWLDHGLSICPKTRQTLAHTNLIPNYTVKAMIANWCLENNIKTFPSRSSVALAVADVGWKQNLDKPPSRLQECHDYQVLDAEALMLPSQELSYVHSRCESAASAVSSPEYVSNEESMISIIVHRNVSNASGEIVSEFPASDSPPNKEFGFYPKPACNCNDYSRTNSLQFSDSESDEITTSAHVKKLIEDLKSQSNEVQAIAAAKLRILAKHRTENRIIIGKCGAVKPLLSLLHSEMKSTQEHAVTALLNLSINEENKTKIAECEPIQPLVHVLKLGTNEAKANAAATIFSISFLEEYKAKIGRSSAIKALVDLLGLGTLRGKKDAATALFNLSIFHENKNHIVQAGAVKYLIELMDPNSEMVDKAVALLANLATIGEGRTAIVHENGIPLLIEILESGSQSRKENSASVLSQLCLNSTKFCTLVLQEGAVPSLVALSQSGTPRSKEKAQQLLSHFRNQREGSKGKGKP